MKKAKKPLVSLEEITTEREISELQLERLRSISRERLLTYEETKIFDLLVKNLLLSKGESTAISTSSYRIEETKKLSEAELIEAANTVDESIINKSLDFVDKDDTKKDN